MCCIKPRKRTETVALNISNSGANKFNFDDQPNLRNRRIIAVSARTFEEIPKDFNGQDVLPTNILKNMFATFVENNTEETFSKIPFADLCPGNVAAGVGGNNGCQFEFDAAFINFPKSYISFSDSAALAAALAGGSKSVIFTFTYEPITESEYREQKRQSANKPIC